MAKKQKRQYSRSTAPVRTVEGSAPTAAPRTGTPLMSPSPARSSSVVEFNPDYGYVMRDLKKIGILAGSFIGVLIILSFILK